MAIDEREYTKAKHGWSIEKLTGCRRTAAQIENSQYDDLIKESAKEEKRKQLAIAMLIFFVCFITWHYINN